VIMKFLHRLSGVGAKAVEREAVEYKGFSIVPAPRKVSGGWTTEGTISKTTGSETRSEHFIRADMLMSEDEAVDYSVTKAKKIIDELGERIFRQ
jgi:hypothetical protein